VTIKLSRELYISNFPKSKAIHEKAMGVFPRGSTHDAWYRIPFPIHMKEAKGARQWDVDGYEYIDYFGGHGGLILGHAHPSVVEAVTRQIERGTQYGACNNLALEWAELIKKLIRSADRVEFTSSGTEANMLAVRLARAFTGRGKIVKFRGHFGGWYDPMTLGAKRPWDVPTSLGILPSVLEETIVIPCNDGKVLRDELKNRDVALLMVEAFGASSGMVGIDPSFYPVMREMTLNYGTLLLFDEVVTGFRFSPGGVQAVRGIVPDLTSLGKAITGMIPGAGAIVGRTDVMDLLSFKDTERDRYERVSHEGTFNGNPLCAAAGTAALKILETGEPQRKADELAALLRRGMQEVMDRRGVIGCVYGDFSVFHLYFGACEMQGKCHRKICLNEEKVRPLEIGKALALNMTLNHDVERCTSPSLWAEGLHLSST
jgi:glutamate-1-semialdehyde 2,1-aminomutase